MDTFVNLKSELLSRLMVADNSSLFTDTRLGELINNSYLWATNMFIWFELTRGRMTSTVALQEYYDSPTDFRTGTIYRLEIDGKPYYRKNFEDYLQFKYNNSQDKTNRLFAIHGRQFFAWPIPSASGVNNMTAWGAIQAPKMSASGDKTIFSDSNIEGNEAILKKSLSVAIKRVDAPLAAAEEKDALGILARLNKIQWDSYQRDQRIQHPFFSVPNFFPGNGASGRSPIGNFNYNNENIDL